MSRRPAIRAADIRATLSAIKEAGLEPTALDTRPDGSFRWHFTKPDDADQDDLDRELEAFEAEHGQR